MNGTFSAGKLMDLGHYKAFVPNCINRDWQITNMEVINLLSYADRELGKLDMYSEHVDIELYISLHVAKEATLSSRIEGTRTHIEEVFMEREDIVFEKRDDWEEVQNYIKAMEHSVSLLDTLPFSNRLIKEAHKILLSGVRGHNRQPGEFRTTQNWLGGTSISEATFVPPPHHLVGELMSDLEKFANSEDHPLPELLKIAIIHYQFETIHPFLDGNGRVGRLLITLYLVYKGILRHLILYLSAYFEKTRSEYYKRLTRVRTHNELDEWFIYFLTGIITTTQRGSETFEEILKIDKSLDNRLKPLGNRAADARLVINKMYHDPILSAKDVEEVIGKSSVTAYKLLDDMQKLGLLVETTGNNRGKRYVFEEYVNLFRR